MRAEWEVTDFKGTLDLLGILLWKAGAVVTKQQNDNEGKWSTKERRGGDAKQAQLRQNSPT